ncbi:MAG: FAD-binding oxidoreductase [Solirubrobacteraceae bacterium]
MTERLTGADRTAGRPGGGLTRELAALVGGDHVLAPPARAYLHDAAEGRGIDGRLDAVVRPGEASEVAQVVAWCYAHDVAIIPRGGGSGLAGGAVPLDGGVVLSLERLARLRSLDPLLWRISVEAGMTTADLRRRARETGLYFPPDPGAAEQSQIGGNIATNAGGPHAFKYGPTGAWVTGLEVVLPPGELVTLGGPIRKESAGYDLKGLLVGSEGTLGVITAAWLRLVPAPEAAYPVIAVYPSVVAGCAAVEAVLGNGVQAAALEFLDRGALELSSGGPPLRSPGDAALMVIAEADGTAEEAARVREQLVEILGDGSLAAAAPTEPTAIADVWRWRRGVSHAVRARRGAKISEDIVVPVDRLAEAIEETVAIGTRHGLEACSWGHAGDGNLHATYLLDPDRPDELRRVEAAVEEVFALAARLGGSISGEHGIGWVKRGQLARVWSPPALALHRRIKEACDPRGLMNPGKKLADRY